MSDGVQVDSTPPSISKSQKVREITSQDSTKDIDFINTTEDLFVTWEGVFWDAQTNISKYFLTVGKHTHCTQTHPFTENAQGSFLMSIQCTRCMMHNYHPICS